MLDFSSVLDLPTIWGSLIATAVFLYVILDGFDLGIGILFPFAPSKKCRDRMMNSIAPFWDGNETWLVLGGGGLFAAFPLAYAIIMPALYVPITLMLIGLIFRGVAFEFRFKAETQKVRNLWNYCFHFGSLLATFMQGMILGEFIHGINVEGRSFAGGPLDWLNAFSVMTGMALVFGYILLGSTWLILKTEDETQKWAKGIAKYSIPFVALFMAIVSLTMPFMNEAVGDFWFKEPNVYYLSILPVITFGSMIMLYLAIDGKNEAKPLLLAYVIFACGFIGLGLSVYPWIVPYEVTLAQAAAASTSLSLLLIGAAIMLPVILAYTAFCYYVFRGKASHETHY